MTFIGKHHSEESKKKMSEAKKGKKFSEEHRKKISEFRKGKATFLGKHHTTETKEKMSLAKIGKPKRPFTEEHKKNISKALKNKPKSDEHKEKLSGKNNPMFGKHHSEEAKKKLSEAFAGDKHPNYIDGRSFEPYCEKFNEELKRKVRNRDNHLCQLCGAKENGEKHCVHHIHYDKKNCYPDLITLCRKCNVKVNYDREYYEQLFMNKLNERGLLLWTKSIETCKEANSIDYIHIYFYSLTPYQQRQSILKILEERLTKPIDIMELLA